MADPDRAPALRGIELYLGDGASVSRPIVRIRDGTRIGHASIREQLEWCAAEGVSRAIFTHCGSENVRGDGRTLAARVRGLGRALGVDARIARDGRRLEIDPISERKPSGLQPLGAVGVHSGDLELAETALDPPADLTQNLS